MIVGRDRLLSYAEVAALTGRSTRSVRRWVREGKLRAVGIGHARWVRESDLIAALRVGTNEPDVPRDVADDAAS
jgi:excisionase family DNA binding protein